MNRPIGGLSGSTAERLEAILLEKREASGTPGIAAGILAGGELAWFGGAGWADPEGRVTPTEHSIARVASVTKTFTATAILQLRDRGLLALNDPLERHVPEFAAVQERGGRRSDVTIRAILTHRSGLETESPTTSWDVPAFGDMAAILAALPETAVVIPAMTIWKYSNLGFALLGEVIARRAGLPYAEYVRAEIFEPLGLRETAFQLDGGLAPLAMTGHQPVRYEDRAAVAPVVSLDGLTAAGQLQSNVHDLARWVAFHLGTAPIAPAIQEAVLAGTSRVEAQQANYAQPDFALGQGLAWRMVRIGEHVFHNHGGSVHGFNSSVGFHVPSGLGVVVLANLWPTTVAGDCAFALLEAALAGGRPLCAGGRACRRDSGRLACTARAVRREPGDRDRGRDPSRTPPPGG